MHSSNPSMPVRRVLHFFWSIWPHKIMFPLPNKSDSTIFLKGDGTLKEFLYDVFKRPWPARDSSRKVKATVKGRPGDIEVVVVGSGSVPN